MIGFDGLEMTEFMNPALTTVQQPKEKLAKSAIDLLMKQIDSKDAATEQLTYDAELLEQDSVREI